MNKKEIFETALHIASPWYISNIKFNENTRRLDIYIDFEKGTEFYYESVEENISGTYKPYDTSNKTWRHLNFFEHECYLHARIPRVKLKGIEKEPVRQITPSWAGKCPGFTLLFEALIIQLAQYMPIHSLCRIVKESDFKIWKILYIYTTEARKNIDLSKLKFVGIDETSRKKGHNYITLFVDLESSRTVFITKGKDNKTVKDFVIDLKNHKGDPKNIEHVSQDMSPAFKKGVNENLPNAQITFDKFHLTKVVNKGVDEVRKGEVKNNPILKKSKYVLLKNVENLKSKEKDKLEEIKLSKMNLKSLRAYNIRLAFQHVYSAKNKEEFESLLNKWYFWATHSRLKPIVKVAKTIKEHWYGVLAWFESKISNGVLEGLNSLIQAAKAKARGFKTTKNLITIAYLVTGKLDFRKVNKHYLPT